MKILHVISSLAMTHGGTRYGTIQMVKALRGAGVDAEIATTNEDGDSFLKVPLGQRTEYQGVPVRFFPFFSYPISFSRKHTFSVSLTRWLWSHICEYDILHIHEVFSYVPTMAMWVARVKNIPYIVEPHGSLGRWPLQQKALKKLICFLLIERSNLKHAAALHFNSLQEKEETMALGFQTPFFVLPHGIEPPKLLPHAREELRQSMKLPLDEPVVLFMSRLHPGKGLGYLISALEKIRKERFVLAVAGSSSLEHEKQIRRLVKKAGLEEKVFYFGFVSGYLKQLLLQGSDFFVLPSHSESFGVVILEALASGLPVITTPQVGLAPLVLEHGLGSVVDLNKEKLTDAVLHWLRRPSDPGDFKEKARRIISAQYNWDSIAAQMAVIYQAVLDKKPILFKTNNF